MINQPIENQDFSRKNSLSNSFPLPNLKDVPEKMEGVLDPLARTKKFRIEKINYAQQAEKMEQIDAALTIHTSDGEYVEFILAFPGEIVRGRLPIQGGATTGVPIDERNLFLSVVDAEIIDVKKIDGVRSSLRDCQLDHFLEHRVDFVQVEDQPVKVALEVLPSGKYRIPQAFMEAFIQRKKE